MSETVSQNLSLTSDAARILAQMLTPAGAEMLAKFAAYRGEQTEYKMDSESAHVAARASAEMLVYSRIYSDMATFKAEYDISINKQSQQQLEIEMEDTLTNHGQERFPEEQSQQPQQNQTEQEDE